jgi:hypothetical protein
MPGSATVPGSSLVPPGAPPAPSIGAPRAPPAPSVAVPVASAGVAPRAPSVAVPVASTGVASTAPVAVPVASTGVAPRASSVAVPVASASAAVAPPVVRRRGPSASGESYEVWLETTGGYSAGSAGAVVLSLAAKAPFKCNAQYPYKLALDAPAPGVSYPSAVVRGMQVDGKHATLLVPFTASRAGSFPIGGTLSFSTCTPERCLVDKAHIAVVVDVH